MKELSIEEKAKRYDELLVKLQEAKIDNNVCDERYCCVIDDIVPELKESEDERIRKEILAFINRKKSLGSVSPEELGKSNSWIAWLEKQGEEIDFANREYWRGYKEGKQEILDKYADFEKQGEQKPADKIVPKFKAGDIIRHKEQGFTCKITAVYAEYRVSECNGTHLPFDAQDAYELVEQKPAKKEDWCFEKGKWYVKLCHDYEGDLRHFKEGYVYQAVSETSITDGYHHVSLGSWQIPKYFRPATKEELVKR